MGSHQDLLLRYRLTDFYKMVSLKVVLAFAIMSSTVAIFVFRPPSKECRSDRDCQTFRRTSSRRQSYLLPGKCNKVPDTWCHIGNFFGKRNRCNAGSRCAECLANEDCASGKEGTPECSNYSCRLIPEKCSGHSQCPGARKCSNDGRCILNKDWCDSDYDCDGDQRCSYNVCVDFCRHHWQCPGSFGSQKCTNDGQCIPYKDWCDSDHNCPGDKKCSNNVCRNSCRYDRDCGVSQKCSDDICWAVA